MATAEVRGVLHAYDFTVMDRSKHDLDGQGNADAPTLVFVHGWLLSRSYWQPLIDCLSPYYSCLAYDLRGFGESGAKNEGDRYPEQGYTLADYADDLQALLEKLEIKQAWLVGHSLGGSIALWAAKKCDRVVGVTCLNSGGGIYLKEDFEKFRSVGQQLVRNRFPWLIYVPFFDFAFARMMVKKPLARRWGKQRIRDFLAADPEAALRSLLDTTTEKEVHQLPQLVAQLRQPVYFLAGSQDSVMELKYVHHLASFHPSFGCMGENVIEISDCGHLAMVEQVATVSENILTILSKNTP
ncbi:MAG: alpha/beta hydrolase [Limnothrix sp.]